MTGAYLRVCREGKWLSVQVEYLTDAERHKLLGDRGSEEILRWLDVVCHELAKFKEEKP